MFIRIKAVKSIARALFIGKFWHFGIFDQIRISLKVMNAKSAYNREALTGIFKNTVLDRNLLFYFIFDILHDLNVAYR